MTAHTQLLAFEEAEWLYLCVQAEQAKHFRELRLSHRPPASADSAKLPFVLTADCRWQRWARATSEATLRTRMGLVNVLAETGRPEMVEEICRRVEGVGCTPAERSAPRVLISTFSCGEAIGMFGIETTL